jgi:hypothetical protein
MSAIQNRQESGHQGPLTSLGGIIGIQNLGRKVTRSYPTVGQTTNLQILPENLRRISAIIRNTSDTGYVFLSLSGYIPDDLDIILYPGEYLQIDKDLPWTGSINGLAVTADCVCTVTEISVQ